MAIKIDDALTQEGAERIAGAVKAYWRERGHEVEAFVEQDRRETLVFYTVRGDLINGLPRSHRAVAGLSRALAT